MAFYYLLEKINGSIQVDSYVASFLIGLLKGKDIKDRPDIFWTQDMITNNIRKNPRQSNAFARRSL